MKGGELAERVHGLIVGDFVSMSTNKDPKDRRDAWIRAANDNPKYQEGVMNIRMQLELADKQADSWNDETVEAVTKPWKAIKDEVTRVFLTKMAFGAISTRGDFDVPGDPDIENNRLLDQAGIKNLSKEKLQDVTMNDILHNLIRGYVVLNG